MVDDIFAVPAANNSFGTAWLGIICYAFQLYFDFSGYSDMAIGLGKMFGFNFLENFNLPYISKSITEFWRRWHISLSSWFRDYLYIPLGGNRRGNVYVNLFIVFVCTGLWHGASLNFLIWGLWHGVFMIIERLLRKKTKEEKKSIRESVKNGVKHVYTLLVVLIGWVFFRATDLTYAWNYLKVMFGVRTEVAWYEVSYYLDKMLVVILLCAIVLSMGIIEKIKESVSLKQKWMINVALGLKGTWLVGILLVSIMFVINSTYNPFIYFRF